MKPCGTLAITGNYSDVWSFTSTLWNLLLEKLSIRLNEESEASVDFSPS